MSERKRVLVVDDDGMIRRLVERILEREGFAVTTARNGAEAISHLEFESFDGLVVDLMMPSISGFRLLELLDEDPSISPKWKIVMTAAANTDLEPLDRTSFDVLLPKPFDIDDLRAKVLACAKRAEQRTAGGDRS